MHDIHTQDHWIDGGQGRLFVRTWLPQAPRSDVPIILLHDSLGSVELWRGFPASLCVHSGRPVMAYDRLGFGKSDARVGKLALDFVESEAETGFAALRQGLDIGHATEAKASRRVRVKRRGSPFARGEGRPSAADAPSELDLRSELTENPTPKEWRRGR